MVFTENFSDFCGTELLEPVLKEFDEGLDGKPQSGFNQDELEFSVEEDKAIKSLLNVKSLTSNVNCQTADDVSTQRLPKIQTNAVAS